MQQEALGGDVMVVYNNQQQLTRLCSFQEICSLTMSSTKQW